MPICLMRKTKNYKNFCIFINKSYKSRKDFRIFKKITKIKKTEFSQIKTH